MVKLGQIGHRTQRRWTGALVLVLAVVLTLGCGMPVLGADDYRATVSYTLADGEELPDLEDGVVMARSTLDNLSDVSEWIEIRNIDVRGTYRTQEGKEITDAIYCYDDGVSDWESDIELYAYSRLSFSLEWEPSVYAGQFEAGQSFTIPIMESDDLASFSKKKTEVGDIGTGYFLCKDGLLTFTVELENEDLSSMTLNDGWAEGGVTLDADGEGTEISFVEEDPVYFAVYGNQYGAGGSADPIPGSVQVVKTQGDPKMSDELDGQSDFEALQGLKGFSFHVRSKSSNAKLEFWETKDGYLLSDAKPSEGLLSDEKVDQVTTGSDGRLVLLFAGSDLNRYYCLEEIWDSNTPEGYVPGNNLAVSFKPITNSTVYVAVYNQPEDKKPEPEPDPGTLKVIKVGVDGTKETSLEGVSFTLSGDGLSNSITGKTDGDGILLFEGLSKGTYQLIETAPSGYEGVGTITLTVEENEDGEYKVKFSSAVEDFHQITLSGWTLTVRNNATGGGGDNNNNGGGGGGSSRPSGGNGGQYVERSGSSGGGKALTISTPPETTIEEPQTPQAETPPAVEAGGASMGIDNPNTGVRAAVGVAMALAVAAGVAALGIARKLKTS